MGDERLGFFLGKDKHVQVGLVPDAKHFAQKGLTTCLEVLHLGLLVRLETWGILPWWIDRGR